MSEKPAYNGTELLATVASRILQNGDSVFVGTGLPVIAGMLAQKTHAPELLVFFEAGAIGHREIERAGLPSHSKYDLPRTALEEK